MRVRERERERGGLPKINMAVNFEERRRLIDSKKLKPKTTSFNIYIYIKTAGSQLGLPGSTGFCRANSLTGLFINPARFQSRVSRVSGQPVGPGFKTMILISFIIYFYFIFKKKYEKTNITILSRILLAHSCNKLLVNISCS
jgi:hypothetical protein